MPKLSIYLSDEVAERLGATDNVSGRLAAIIQRYRLVTEALRPRLTGAEWRALDAAITPEWLKKAGAADLRMLWALVQSSGAPESVVTKLAAMGDPELVAFVEELERRRREAPATKR